MGVAAGGGEDEATGGGTAETTAADAEGVAAGAGFFSSHASNVRTTMGTNAEERMGPC